MERTINQVRQILYALSLRNPEAGYTPNQIEILAQEYHEDMGCISAEALQGAYLEIRQTFNRFPKYSELVEVARMKERPMINRKIQIEERPTFKSDLDIEKMRKKLSILAEVSSKQLSYDVAMVKMAEIDKGN